jgi:hypothetical protein
MSVLRFSRTWFASAALVFAVTALAAPPVADVSLGTMQVEWQPTGDFAGMTLRVSGPLGVVEQEFAAGENPLFDLRSMESVADGMYTWEIVAAPRLDESVRRAMAESRTAGDGAAEGRLRASGALPNAADMVQSGSFRVVGGAILQPTAEAEPSPGLRRVTSDATGGDLRRVTAEDQVIPDDLIVQGSLCVGFDCVNNESFGFDTIRMKENNTRIKFEDTSTATGFPGADWQLTANDSTSGGLNKFSIEETSASRVPFTVVGGAPTNSLFVASTGRVGLRTSAPVLDLHISTSNTPGIRLEQTNAGGFTAQTWDIAGNEANFFVRDVTGGSRLPLRIRPGAPTSSIDVNASGDVGIGTASPAGSLHITRNGDSTGANSAKLVFQDSTNTVNDVIGFFAFRKGTSTDNVAVVTALSRGTGNEADLLFGTAGNTGPASTRMIIEDDGDVGIGIVNPVSRLHVDGGDIRVSGGSFIDDGTTLNVPDYVFESDYQLMPLDELARFIAERKHLPKVPNVDEVKTNGLNVSQFQMRLLEKVEELTLYTLAQESHIGSLRQTNAELLERLERLESVISESAAQ